LSKSKKQKVVPHEAPAEITSPLPAPAFSLAGEKKFEKMRDVKVKDSKTIHIYISLVK
jgi:hypothetical protein